MPVAPDYEISTLGRIRCIAHNGTLLPAPRILKPTKGARGYRHVTVYRDGEPFSRQVQYFVAISFIGPRPSPKHYALFRDNNRENLTPENILWGTAQDRNELRRMHGTYKERPHQVVDGVIHYRCIYCKEWLPPERFYKLKGGVSALGNRLTTCGLTSDCRMCSTERRMERKRAKKRSKQGEVSD